jgi:hypothetical protein
MRNDKNYIEIIDEVYRKYADSHFKKPENPNGSFLEQLGSVIPMEYGRAGFENEIRKNCSFAKKYGLVISEQTMSTEDRNEWFLKHRCGGNRRDCKTDWKDYELDQQAIPSKIIQVTYNNKTIEIYE